MDRHLLLMCRKTAESPNLLADGPNISCLIAWM
jgi:hypothetical protein